LEELKAKMTAEEAAKSKPVFLTREEREKQAIARRQKEVDAHESVKKRSKRNGSNSSKRPTSF